MRRIAVLPGDGIGKEVVEASMGVLDAVAENSSFAFSAEYFDAGAERYLSDGSTIHDDELRALSASDAVFLGALGDPRGKPGVLEKGVLIRIRTHLGTYINLRPVRMRPGLCPLRDPRHFDLDFIRENSEDFYMGLGLEADGPGAFGLGSVRDNARIDISMDFSVEPVQPFGFEVGIITRSGAERFADYAFSVARDKGRDKVTLVDKANVCTGIYGLQRKVFEAKSEEYGIDLEYMYVDAMAMALVRAPQRFGVVALPNLFGDVLTDLGAELQGGLGVSPSANVRPGGTGMFEPVHGSAPDIAGKGLANPFAAILAAAMMLSDIGFREEADRVSDAVDACISKGRTTPDLGGKLSTSEAGKAVADEVRASK